VIIPDLVELGGPASRVDGIFDDGGINMQMHAHNAALGDGRAESILPCSGFRVRLGPFVVSAWVLFAAYCFAGAPMTAVTAPGTGQYRLFGSFNFTTEPAVAIGTAAGLAVAAFVVSMLMASAAATEAGTGWCALGRRMLGYRDTLGLILGALVTALSLALLAAEQGLSPEAGLSAPGVTFATPAQRSLCAKTLRSISDAPVLRIVGALLPIVWFKRSTLWDSTIFLGGSSQASERATAMARDGLAVDLTRGRRLLDGDGGLESAAAFVDADIDMRLRGTCAAPCCPTRAPPASATRSPSSVSWGDGFGLFRPGILIATLAVAYAWAGDAVVRPVDACVMSPLASRSNSDAIFGAAGVVLAWGVGGIIAVLSAQELVRCLEEPIALAEAWSERVRLLLQAGMTPLELSRERVDDVDDEAKRVVEAFAGARPALTTALDTLARERVAHSAVPGAASPSGESELRAARRMVLGGALIIHIDRAQAVLDVASPVLLVTVFSAVAYAINLIAEVYAQGSILDWLTNPANILDTLADPVLYTTAAAFAAFYATALTQTELTAGLELLSVQGTVRRLGSPAPTFDTGAGSSSPPGDMPTWVHALTPRPHRGPAAEAAFLAAVAKWRGFPRLFGLLPLPASLPVLLATWLTVLLAATLPSLILPAIRPAA